jgi:RNA polymerase sigma-70 factor, ECF subfamily
VDANGTRRRRDWTGLDELRPYLRTYLGRRCRDESEVDDMIQETLIRAARYRTGLTDTDRLRSWVLRIASNVFRDHLRRESRLPRLGTPEDVLPILESREPVPGELRDEPIVTFDGLVMERDAAVARIGGALRLLRPEDRDVLGSFYGGERSCGRTAIECDIPPGLVKVRLFRARRRLVRTLRWLLAAERHARLLGEPRPRGAEGVRRQAGSAARLRLPGRRAVAIAALLVTLLAGPAAARVDRQGLRPGGDAPAAAAEAAGSRGVEEQLAYARALKFALRGTSGEARRRARQAAVDAYREVRTRFPEASAAVA